MVVIGAGWGGFGAAHALAKAEDVDVLLLDSADNPGGLSAGWRVAGRPVEPGIKGRAPYSQLHNRQASSTVPLGYSLVWSQIQSLQAHAILRVQSVFC